MQQVPDSRPPDSPAAPEESALIRQALVGALGGALLGLASLLLPTLVRPDLRLPLPFVIFLVVAMAILGALVALMNVGAADRRGPPTSGS